MVHYHLGNSNIQVQFSADIEGYMCNPPNSLGNGWFSWQSHGFDCAQTTHTTPKDPQTVSAKSPQNRLQNLVVNKHQQIGTGRLMKIHRCTWNHLIDCKWIVTHIPQVCLRRLYIVIPAILIGVLTHLRSVLDPLSQIGIQVPFT